MNPLHVLKASAIALAAAVTWSNAQADDVHTFHHITITSGSWSGQLVITSPGENAYFTDATGNKKGSLYSFDHLTAVTPFAFGFGFAEPDTDFDVSYTLTLVEKAAKNSQFVSKACQFNISAKGPANPDIRTESYNDADCHYQVTGKGEDYTVG